MICPDKRTEQYQVRSCQVLLVNRTNELDIDKLPVDARHTHLRIRIEMQGNLIILTMHVISLLCFVVMKNTCNKIWIRWTKWDGAKTISYFSKTNQYSSNNKIFFWNNNFVDHTTLIFAKKLYACDSNFT